MGWRTLGVVAAAVFAATTIATPALAATPRWQVSALPLPPELPDASGYVWGSDGHGGYVGTLDTAKGNTVVTWNDGTVGVRGTPDGYDFVGVAGESSNDTVLVLADGKLFTLDGTGFHGVPTGSYTDITSAVMGPRGDIAATAPNPAEPQSTVVLYSSPTGAAGLRPLVGALPNSTPAAIDDDGTVLLNDQTGPYLVHAGATRRLLVSSSYTSPYGAALRHGIVVGNAVPVGLPGPQSLVWSPTSASNVGAPLEKGATAYGVNATGLIVGGEFQLAVPEGPAAVWQGTTFQAELPLLAGTTKATARFVDDSGTIAGWASDRPLDEGGRPVVWRLVSTG